MVLQVSESLLKGSILSPQAWLGLASLQSCPTLCDPRDGSPPGSPIPGILQARTLEGVCHFLLQCMKVKSESEVGQSCPTLSNPMDCSLPGSSIHGIFQARVLEWGAIAFSPHISTRPKFNILFRSEIRYLFQRTLSLFLSLCLRYLFIYIS